MDKSIVPPADQKIQATLFGFFFSFSGKSFFKVTKPLSSWTIHFQVLWPKIEIMCH